MSWRIGNRVFAPRGWGIAVTALLLAAFVSLGYWQIGRYRDKQAMVESFATGSETSVELAAQRVAELPRYQHVRVRGTYDPTRQLLLDNMPSAAGRPGYRVLTPLRRPGSDVLLMVDRGWVPLGATREDLPDVSVPSNEREVSGKLDELPAPGLRLGDAAAPDATNWPRVLNFPTRRELETVLGTPVEPRLLLLDAGAADGFEREWRPAMSFGPERHLGYAIQWFALALTLTVIFVALSLRRDEA
jgi:surfeit locus 1 family protein